MADPNNNQKGLGLSSNAPQPQGSPPMDPPPMGGPMNSGPMGPSQGPPQGPPPGMPPPQQDANDSVNPALERIEEIAEAIIDEKWNDLVKTINKIIDWKDRTENVIVKIQSDFENLRKDYDNLTKGVLGKVGEYNQNISNIGVEIKAMEKVFEKVLPLFTENVHTLDRITKEMKDHHNVKKN